MTLPRLLDKDRVEVRLTRYGTHVRTLPELTALIAHLEEARRTLESKLHYECVEADADDEDKRCLLGTPRQWECAKADELAEAGKSREDCQYWRPVE